MNPLARYAAFIGSRPGLTIVLVLAATMGMLGGATLSEQDESGLESFVDPDSETGRAFELLQQNFPEQGRPVSIQVVVRGDITSPEAVNGLALAAIDLASDPDIGPTLNPVEPPVTYASLITEFSGVQPGELNQDDIDRALAVALADDPRAALLSRLIGFDETQSVRAGFGFVTQQRGLSSTEDLNEAGASIERILSAADLGSSTEASTVSNAQFEEALQDGLADTQILFPITLAAIVGLLYLYYRSIGDTLITLAGVIIAILWFLGSQGALGPKGLGVVGPSGIIGAVIPVMMIGLTVDYAIQVLERRREHNDLDAGQATAMSIGHSGAAIALGAVTTAVAFATNVAGPLPPIRDFGVLAAAGIAAAFVVMTSFVPAARTLLDRRRRRHASDASTRVVGGWLAPAGRSFALIAQRSAAHARVIAAVSAVAFAGALVYGLGVSTNFSNADFLPDGHPTTANVELVSDQLGGNQSTISILLRGDLTSTEGSQRITELDEFLRSPQRPDVIVADPATSDDLSLPVTAITDDGRTALINVAAVIDEPADATAMIDTIENAVTQDPTLEVTVTGDDLLPATISREITRTQVLGTSITIATALLLLVGYFAWTHRRPMLGVIATLPVAGVLALVLAFMRLAGVVYNPLTALLTSLTIGLGVDYTIHFTHRYLHELPQSTAATAIRDAASTTGVALVGSALTTFVGFAILSLAPVSVISELGTLTAATIAATMIATATTLPALLRLSAQRERSRPAAPEEQAVVRNRNGITQ